MNILAAFAHPDDETILIGGTLAMFASRGATLHILSATRGEGGELGEPPVCEQDALGAVREEELRCAGEALGATSVRFLDYIDPLITEEGEILAFDAEVDQLAEQLLSAAMACQASAMITHGSNGEYGHPAHKLMHTATCAALEEADQISLYTVSGTFEDHPYPPLANKDDQADFIFQIDPWIHLKRAAAECHRTQHALFVRRRSKKAGRKLTIDETLMRLESLCRVKFTSKNRDDPFADFVHHHCADAIWMPGEDPT
jgi:LmbE family N-acetylglucosaminyl deacetylase